MEDNNSIEVQDNCYKPSCLFSKAEIGLIIGAFALLFFMSLVGNLISFYLIATKSSLKRANRFTMLSLSVADLLVTVFCMLVVPLDYLVFDRWLIGNFMCKFITFAQSLGIASSLLHLAVVTLQNFMAVCFPFYARSLKGKDIHFTCIAWSIAIIESCAYINFKSLQEFPDGSAFCIEVWTSNELRRVFLFTNAALMVALPIVSIATLNICSIFALHRAKQKIQGTNSFDRSSEHARKRIRRTEGAVKKIFIILAVLIFCSIPYQALGLWSEITQANNICKASTILFLVFVWLYFANMAIHPLLYTLFSWGYRAAIRESFGSITSKRRSTTTAVV